MHTIFAIMAKIAIILFIINNLIAMLVFSIRPAASCLCSAVFSQVFVIFVLAMRYTKNIIGTGTLFLLSLLALSLFTSCGADESAPERVELRSDTVVREEFAGKPNKIVYWNRRREFNDKNDVHLAAAQQIGISPLASRDDIPGVEDKLNLICANMGFRGPEPYIVENLTHSVPLLVDEAAELLYDIGANFQDSLRNKHLPQYSIVVTSVLRTDADVKRLSRRNVNAVERSVHCYGTTVDISYKRFVKLDAGAKDARDVDLIAVLGEVLRDLKKAEV